MININKSKVFFAQYGNFQCLFLSKIGLVCAILSIFTSLNAFALANPSAIEDLILKGNPKQALIELEKQKKEFNPVDYGILKSSALITLRNFKESEDILTPLYKADPNNGIIANNYAAALWGQGKKDLARKVLEKNLIGTSPAYRSLRKMYVELASESYAKALNGKIYEPKVEILAATKVGVDIERVTEVKPAPVPPPTVLAQAKTGSELGGSDGSASRSRGNEGSLGAKPELRADTKSDARVDTRVDSRVDVKSEKAPVSPAPPLPAPAASPEFIAVENTINQWATAWSKKNIDGYLGAYSTNFVPSDNLSYAAWKEQRRQRVTKPGPITVQADIINKTYAGKNIIVTIRQKYTSTNLKSNSVKYLEFTNEQGKWHIVRESYNLNAKR